MIEEVTQLTDQDIERAIDHQTWRLENLNLMPKHLIRPTQEAEIRQTLSQLHIEAARRQKEATK